jgi:RNA polymerase sigma-70 factor (ECF subfamily)
LAQNTSEISPKKQLNKYTDLELIECVLKTGENIYFGELYDRYADKVYGKCIQMVKETDLAQDLAHDVLVKAFLKLNTFKGNSAFGTWLFQVTYTYCIDYIRKNKNIFKEELEEERFNHLESEDAEMEEMHEKELLEMKIEYVQQIIFELKADELSMILQKYQDNMSISELAEIYGASESAIKMKLKRTRDKIIERYYELNPEHK